MQLLSSPFKPSFAEFFDSIESDCVICSPYISLPPFQAMVASLERRQTESTVRVRVITDLSAVNLLNKSTDIAALIYLKDRIEHTSLVYLPRLHAKVFISGLQSAIIGSANFTVGGSSRNLEYGVRIDDPALVDQVRQDITGYAELGSSVTRQNLIDLSRQVDELRESIDTAQKTVGEKYREAAASLQRETTYQLARIRVEGRSLQAIFSDTILYLLERGPKSTEALYHDIQEIHPDLCDDEVIRVISGDPRIVWRHRLRHAQQSLRAQGKITRDTETRQWRLTVQP